MTNGSDTTHPAAGGGGTPAACATAPCPLRKVVKITARLPITPSVRGSHAILPTPLYKDFTSASGDKALGTNTPTVLLRNSSPITLTAETSPPNQTDVVWKIEPNPGGTLPTFAPAGLQATLTPDQTGGYAISATLEGHTVYWNLVLAEVSIDESSVVLNTAKMADASGAGQIVMGTGIFDVTQPAACCMYAKAKVKVTAGHQASLDAYCDKIQMGMCQNMLSDSVGTDYDGGGKVRLRSVVQPLAGTPIIVDPAVVLTDIGFPLIDTGRLGLSGGDSISLGRTQSTPTTGTARLVETCDSPSLPFPSLHPEFNAPSTKQVTGVVGAIQFSLFVVAFSTDAVFSFVAYGSASWKLNYIGSATWTHGNVAYVPSASAGITGDASFAAIPHGKEANQAHCEVLPPSDLAPGLVFDAR